LIIWDILFLEGTIILFKAALGILKIMKKDLMQLDNLEELNEYLEKREFSFHDISEVVYFLLLRRFEFDNSLINRLRKSHEKKIMKEMNYYSSNILIEQQKKFEEDLKSKKLIEGDLSRVSCLGVTEKCNVNWPLCIYDKFFKLNLINFLVFRTADDVNVIQDYFYSSKKTCNKFHYKINEGADIEKIRKKLTFPPGSHHMKNTTKTQLNLTKVYFNNIDFTLKKPNIEKNPDINEKDINHNSPEDNNLLEQTSSIKYSTPETKKLNSFMSDNPYKAPNITNLHLNNLSKKDINLDLHKDIAVSYIKHDNLVKNKKEIVFVDNKSDHSYEDFDDSVAQDNLCLFTIKDNELIGNTDKEEEENDDCINYFNEISFDNKRNSINEKIKNLDFSKGEKCMIDRKNDFLNNCSSSKNSNEKSQDDSNKRAHSNKLSKIKDLQRKNKKRIKIYRSLLINRRKHYCQIIESIQNTQLTSSDSKRRELNKAKIKKRKFIILKKKIF